MNHGKQICKTLKELRMRIAKENDIPFEPEECTNDGPCQGTCPKCEQELREIEDALSEKKIRGDEIKLEGIVSNEDLCSNGDENIDDNNFSEEQDDYPFIYTGLVFGTKDYGDIELPPPPPRFSTYYLLKLGGIIDPPVNLDVCVIGEVLKQTNNHNIVLSPLGIASILTMLQYGAYVESRLYRHIESLLNGFSVQKFNSNRLAGVSIERGTNLWYDISLGRIKKSYIAGLQEIYGTEPQAVDFSKAEEVKIFISNWAENQTHGMIKNLDVKLSGDEMILIADTIYLKAKWYVPFESRNTRKQAFHNADGSESMVDMMHLKTDVSTR